MKKQEEQTDISSPSLSWEVEVIIVNYPTRNIALRLSGTVWLAYIDITIVVPLLRNHTKIRSLYTMGAFLNYFISDLSATEKAKICAIKKQTTISAFLSVAKSEQSKRVTFSV